MQGSNAVKYLISAPSTKCLHLHLHQVLGKVDSGFTQWRGTMLSVRFQFAFHSLDISCSGSFLIHSGPFLMIILDFKAFVNPFFSGAGFVHACHLEGGCEIGNTFTRNLQKEALPVHAELVDSEEVSLPGGSWT